MIVTFQTRGGPVEIREAFCDFCLRDIEPEIDDIRARGDGGHECSECSEIIDAGGCPPGPAPADPDEDDEAEDVVDPWSDDAVEAALEEQHRGDLLRERGRLP